MCPGGRQICNSNPCFLVGIIEELSCCKRGFKAKYSLDSNQGKNIDYFARRIGKLSSRTDDCYQFLLLV